MSLFIFSFRGPTQMDSYINTEENPVGGHGVFVIGYGTDVIIGEYVDYWLMLNSYGPNWGNGGVAKFDANIRDHTDQLLIYGGVAPTKAPIKFHKRISNNEQCYEVKEAEG
jgi:hypothetical protein